MAQPLHNSSDRPDFDVYPSTSSREVNQALPAEGETTPAHYGFEVRRGGLLSRLPRPDVDLLKRRFTVLTSRARDGASNLRGTAQDGLHAIQSRAADGLRMARTRATDGARYARQRGEYYKREYPLHSLALIAGAAFLAGALIRMGRSSHGSRKW